MLCSMFHRSHRPALYIVARDCTSLDHQEAGITGGHWGCWLPCSNSLWQKGWKSDLTFLPSFPPQEACFLVCSLGNSLGQRVQADHHGPAG